MGVRRICTALALVVGLVVVGPAAGAQSHASRSATHTWHVSLTAPAQFDLTLAELRFAGPGASTLRLALTKAPGLYFAGGALVRHPTKGGPRALVVLVNERPRGSLAPDVAAIGLHAKGGTGLGAPIVSQLADALRRPASSTATARLCTMGRNHGAANLRTLLSAGHALPGFGAAAAVAEAYDVVCGLPYDPAFAKAVTDCTTSLVAGCCPAGAMCVAPTPTPSPTPTPTPTPTPSPTPTPTPTPTPIPTPPVCGCQPRPCLAQIGYACPLAASTEATRVIACPLGASPSIAC